MPRKRETNMCGIRPLLRPPAPLATLPVQQSYRIVPATRLSRALLRLLTPSCYLCVWYFAICFVICGSTNHHFNYLILWHCWYRQIEYSSIWWEGIVLDQWSKIQWIIHLTIQKICWPATGQHSQLWEPQPLASGVTIHCLHRVTHHIPKPLSNFIRTLPREACFDHRMQFWTLFWEKRWIILAERFEGCKISNRVEAFGES